MSLNIRMYWFKLVLFPYGKTPCLQGRIFTRYALRSKTPFSPCDFGSIHFKLFVGLFGFVVLFRGPCIPKERACEIQSKTAEKNDGNHDFLICSKQFLQPLDFSGFRGVSQHSPTNPHGACSKSPRVLHTLQPRPLCLWLWSNSKGQRNANG